MTIRSSHIRKVLITSILRPFIFYRTKFPLIIYSKQTDAWNKRNESRIQIVFQWSRENVFEITGFYGNFFAHQGFEE